jgi:hypothetical protein
MTEHPTEQSRSFAKSTPSRDLETPTEAAELNIILMPQDSRVVPTARRLIPVRVGDTEIEVEAVPVAGTEATSGRAAKATGSVLEAFGRAQDAIIEIAKSTAQMIEKVGAARPDRVDVEFGLKFSASGTVILAGVAEEASLKVTLGYDVAAGRAAGPPAESSAGSS